MKKRVRYIFFCLVFIGLLVQGRPVQATIAVDRQAKTGTLQSIIDSSVDGAVIEITGTQIEQGNVMINKNVTIQGSGTLQVGQITVPNGKELTLGNGDKANPLTIIASNTTSGISVRGRLLLHDGVVITPAGTQSYGLIFEENSTGKITGGEIRFNDSSPVSPMTGLFLRNNVNLEEISGGTIQGRKHSVFMSGATIQTIRGGKFENTNDKTIDSETGNFRMDSGSKIGTISNGDFISRRFAGIVVNSGSKIDTIAGGNFKFVPDGNNYTDAQSYAKRNYFSGITVRSVGSDSSIGSITGGKFEGINGLYMVGDTNSIKYGNANLDSISGGIFVGRPLGGMNYESGSSNEKHPGYNGIIVGQRSKIGTITGGIFGADTNDLTKVPPSTNGILLSNRPMAWGYPGGKIDKIENGLFLGYYNGVFSHGEIREISGGEFRGDEIGLKLASFQSDHGHVELISGGFFSGYARSPETYKTDDTAVHLTEGGTINTISGGTFFTNGYFAITNPYNGKITLEPEIVTTDPHIGKIRFLSAYPQYPYQPPGEPKNVFYQPDSIIFPTPADGVTYRVSGPSGKMPTPGVDGETLPNINPFFVFRYLTDQYPVNFTKYEEAGPKKGQIAKIDFTSKVTVDKKDGSDPIDLKTLNPKEEFYKLSDPSRPGYNFLGWKFVKNGEKDFSFIAVWDEFKIQYHQYQGKDKDPIETIEEIDRAKTITLVPNNGEENKILNESNFKNKKLLEIIDPIWKNHTFLGWTKTMDQAGNITLTANWKENVPEKPSESTIDFLEYNPTTGVGHPTSITVENGKKLTLDTQEGNPVTHIVNGSENVPDPNRPGYTFLGWTKTTDQVGNITLTANWKKQEKDPWIGPVFPHPEEDRPLPKPEEKPESKSLLNKDPKLAYVTGYEDNTFRQNTPLTRSEAAAMFGRILSHQIPRRPNITLPFTDIKPDAWYITNLKVLYDNGIYAGYEDGTFRPEKKITREEFVALMVRLEGVKIISDKELAYKDVPKALWSHDSILTATEHGWVTGYEDGTFKPKDTISRAEAVFIINRVLQRHPERTLIDQTSQLQNRFIDLEKTYWAYYDIKEATEIDRILDRERDLEIWWNYLKLYREK